MTLDTRPLLISTLGGTTLQVAMVVSGHYRPEVARLFAVGGMGISLLAGLTYAMLATKSTRGSALLGGAIAGATCALLGIGVSVALQDVPVSLLLLGTLSSAVTGLIGGWLGRVITHSAVRA
jgi:hypothetical protein